MKTTLTILLSLMVLVLASCGSKSETSEAARAYNLSDPYANWKTNNGVGPIKSLELPAEIDQDLVLTGKEVYEAKCTACHKVDKRFIGPPPKGILEKRTPAWVMNMILNPERMVKEDPMAKQLLIDFNGSPMANQNLTEEEARAVLEYFRTL